MHLPLAVHRHPRARRAVRTLVLRERVGTERVRNVTRGTILAARCDVADSFLSRGLGLLPRARLDEGRGLRITRTATITMFFMRFPIDAVFVDRSRRVVRVAEGLAPWRFAVGAHGAREVIELPAGSVAATGTQAGDELLYEPL